MFLTTICVCVCVCVSVCVAEACSTTEDGDEPLHCPTGYECHIINAGNLAAGIPNRGQCIKQRGNSGQSAHTHMHTIHTHRHTTHTHTHTIHTRIQHTHTHTTCTHARTHARTHTRTYAPTHTSPCTCVYQTPTSTHNSLSTKKDAFLLSTKFQPLSNIMCLQACVCAIDTSL